MSPKPYAIILGAAVWPNETPSPTLRRRTGEAARLWHAGRVAGIVGSGGLGKHPPSEAQMMRRLLVADGVPEEAVLCEDRSTTTEENIRFSKALLPEDAPVIIVTDIYHAPRAWLTARRAGLKATTASPPLKGTSPLRLLKHILREIPALAWYALAGKGR